MLFISTPNSVNYKVMYDALKVENISKAMHFLLEGALSYFIFTDMFAHKCAFIQNYDSCLFHKPQFL